MFYLDNSHFPAPFPVDPNFFWYFLIHLFFPLDFFLFFTIALSSQEELKLRREKEAEIIRQQEFLRTSLRASNKLRALADNLPVSGLVNEAYDEEGRDGYRDRDQDLGGCGRALDISQSGSMCLGRKSPSIRCSHVASGEKDQ